MPRDPNWRSLPIDSGANAIETDALRAVAQAWDRAMIANDADRIGQFMTDDWIIIGTDGLITDRAAFLEQIRSGELTHHTMTTESPSIRIYGAVAVFLAEGVSGGYFRGRAFQLRERQTNVFVQDAGTWRCALTQLSPLPGRPSADGAA